MSFEFTIDAVERPFALGKLESIATEARVMNVLITAVDFRAAERKRNQTKAGLEATER